MVGLREQRKLKGYTQKDVAKALGVKQNAVSQWEKGDRKPTIVNLKKLAVFLDCSLDDLLKGF